MFDKSSSERREFQVFLDDLVAVYVAFAIPYLLTPLIGVSTSIYNTSSVSRFHAPRARAQGSPGMMLSPRLNNDTFDQSPPIRRVNTTRQLRRVNLRRNATRPTLKTFQLNMMSSCISLPDPDPSPHPNSKVLSFINPRSYKLVPWPQHEVAHYVESLSSHLVALGDTSLIARHGNLRVR